MTKMMYCPNCKQNVTIKPQYNLVALILLLLCGIIPGLIYYVLKKDNECPICRTTEEFLEPYRRDGGNDT